MESIWDIYGMDLGLIPLEHSKLDINMESMWDVYGIDLGLFLD